MKYRDLFILFKQALSEWSKDDVPLLSASLSYFVLVSLSPLLVLLIAIMGYLVGQTAVESEIVGQFQSIAGPNFAKILEDVIHQASNPLSTYKATVAGVILLLLGATGLFVQMKKALNIIWGIKPQEGWIIRGTIESYVLSFALTVFIGFLVLIKILLTLILLPASEYFQYVLPFNISITYIINLFGSLVFFTALFAIVYKMLSYVEIGWDEVFLGSSVAAVLFLIGNIAMEVYVTIGNIGSVYGAASSLFIFLVWVFYSAQAFLFGAELVKVHKLMHESTNTEIRLKKSE